MGRCTEERHAGVPEQELQPVHLQLSLLCCEQSEPSVLLRPRQMERGQPSCCDVFTRPLGEHGVRGEDLLTIRCCSLHRYPPWRHDIPDWHCGFCRSDDWLVPCGHLLHQRPHRVVIRVRYDVFGVQEHALLIVINTFLYDWFLMVFIYRCEWIMWNELFSLMYWLLPLFLRAVEGNMPQLQVHITWSIGHLSKCMV